VWLCFLMPNEPIKLLLVEIPRGRSQIISYWGFYAFKVNHCNENKSHLINSQKKLFYKRLFISCLCFNL